MKKVFLAVWHKAQIFSSLKRAARTAMVFCALFAGICASSAFCTDYTWTGGNSNWANYGHWDSGISGWFQYPTAAGDNATISTECEIEVDASFTVGTVYAYENVTLNVDNNKSITINTLSSDKTVTLFCETADGMTIAGYGTGSDVPSIIIGENSKRVNLAGGTITDLIVKSGATVTITGAMIVSGNLTVENGGTLITNGALTVNGSASNAGTISCGENDITFEGAATNDGKIEVSGGTLEFKDALSGSGTISLAADSEIRNAGSETVSVGTLSGGYTATLSNSASGTMEISSYAASPKIIVAQNEVSLGAGTIGKLTVNSSTAATISGALSVSETADNLGTINASAALTVNGNLTNSGTLLAGDDLTFGSDFTNTGTFTPSATVTATGASATFIGGGITIPTFVYAPASASGSGLSVEDANAFTKFTCADKATINIGAQTTIGTAFIANDVTVNAGAKLKATTINIQKESLNLTSSWKTTFAGSGPVECDGLEIFRASATDGVIGTLEVACPLDCSGTIITHSGTTLSVKSGTTLKAQKIQNQGHLPALPATIINAGTITLSATSDDALSSLGPVTNSGTIEATNGGAISFSDKVTGTGGMITTTSGNITCAATTSAAAALGKVTTNTGTLQNTGNGVVSAAELTMNGNAAIKNTGAGSLTITEATAKANASVSNSGSGELTVTTFTCETDGAAITLSGNNTITNLIMKSGDGTLTVDDTQTVTTLNLTGKNASHLLNVEGSGTLNIGSNQNTGEFLSVDWNGPAIGGTNYYGAQNSTFVNVPASSEPYGKHNNNNWILLNSAMKFVWTGETDDSWGTDSNWNYNLVPGLESATGGVDTRGYPVIISNSPATTYLPATAATAYSVGQLTIADADATLTLASASISVVKIDGVSDTADGTLTNNGTIVYSSAGRITDGTNFINDASHGGTVEFAGTSAATDLSGTTTTELVEYYNLKITGSGTYTAAAALTVKNDLTQSAGTLRTNAALTVTNAIEVSGGSAYFNNDSATGTATSAATATFTTSGTISFGNTDGDSFTVAGGGIEHNTTGASILGGTITTTDGAAITLGATSLAADATINAGTGTVTLGAVGGANELTVSGNGTLKPNGDINASKVTMTGSEPTLDGNGKSISSFVYAPSDTSGAGLTVSGDNTTFTDFSCLIGDATLNISDKQTVGTLTLKGVDGHPLTVKGTGSITLPNSQDSGEFLKIERNGVSIGSYYYTATNSTYDPAPEHGEHNHWLLFPEVIKFVWTGATNTDWHERSNWNYNLVPGSADAAGPGSGVDMRKYPVLIPDAPTGNASNFPIVSVAQGYLIGALSVGESVVTPPATPASLTISTTGNLRVTTGNALSNFGKIIYEKTGRVTDTNADDSARYFINDAAKGTVEFNGTSASDLTGTSGGTPVEYYNLEITGSGTYTAAAALTVGNDLTQSAGTLKTNADLTVTKALEISGGSAYFNNDPATGTDTSAATATFTTSGTISLGNTAGDTNVDTFTTAAALDLPAALGGLELAGTITAVGAGITLGHDAVLNADTILASAAELTAPVIVSTNPAASAFTLTTNGALKTSSTNTLTIQDASLTNNDAVNDGNMIFTETAPTPPATAAAQIFAPHTDSTYTSVEINKTSGGSLTVSKALEAATFTVTQNGSLTFSGAVKATDFSVTKNKTLTANAAVTAANLKLIENESATFRGLVTVTGSYTDAATAGNISFSNGCSFTPATTFNTTGTVTLNGSTNACAFDGGLIHTVGETSLRGTIKTAGNSGNDIELGQKSPNKRTRLAAKTTVNAGAGNVKINGTLDGAQDFESLGSGLLTFGGNVGPTTALKTITVTGPTNVSAASIKTTVSATEKGLQLYKGNLTFAANCAVTGTVQAAADIATNGAVTFANDVWLYSSEPAALGGAGGSLAITENLFFAGESKAASVNSNVTAKNILLLHGTVDIAAAATLASSTTGDIIMLGAAYDINDDKDGVAASQVTGLFAYNPATPFARKCAVSYEGDFPGINPTLCPDGVTPISNSWSGAVTTNAGAKISAGQNFYANGLSSLGSGAWTLTIPNNNLQTAAFAEIYNSTIKNCSANYKVAAAENNIVNSCTNVITTRPVINAAWTVYDDAIYISFKDSDGNAVLIENSCNEISAAAANIFNSLGGANAAFAGTYTDADCRHSTNGAGDISAFYIKSDNKWNTDATGTDAGAAESTDRSGAGHATTTTIPCLNLPKALSTVYETLRDSAKNRIGHYYSSSPDTSAENDAPGKTFTKVADKCAPVLTQVLTGQELHAAPGSQADCDAHNFVEFVYSEPVDISGGSTSVADSDVNVQAAADLGATTNTSGGVSFAGLAATASGKINAALRSGSGSPHALYRNFVRVAGAAADDQAARIRVAIAGWVNGTVDGTNKNWPGYISSAEIPAGTITRIANTNIKDKSADQNSLDANTGMPGHPLPTLHVQSDENELYGPWDTTPPSFAPVRINGTTKWIRPAIDGSQEYEFVGASYSTGTLSAIEVHWFDNEPTYAESRQWFSRVGWADASSPTEYSSVASYAADVRGGSKPDSAGANVTAGGIRYCSLYDANNSFKYAVDGTSTYYNFTQNIQAGANSSLFAYAGDNPGAAVHPTGAEDGLYCKLILDQTSYVLQTTFIMTFDSTSCCITDLAGNRIQCGKITMKSIDRTPPAFNMSAVPLGTKNMLVIFSKALNTGNMLLYNTATDYRTVSALEYIPKALELTSASGTGIQIDKNTPARCLFKTRNSTGLLITLNQNAVLKDITSGIFVTAKSEGPTYDPLAGVTAYLTYIQDAIGNYVVDQSQHAFSDFAVNVVQPQYAYDNSLTDEGTPTNFGLYQDGSWAVRDWNAEQANYGTLHAEKEIIMQASLYDGTNDKSGGLVSGKLASGTVTGFFANKPDAASVSKKINETTEKSWRIWQPNWTSDIFPSLAPANNKSYISIDGTYNDNGVLFDIPKESASTWSSGDQISFVFKLGDYTVDHFADGTNEPLYAVRLKNPNDITSLDLWSFKVKKTVLQRGGVTILNNVINVDNGENTVIQVDMKEAGNLNVIVMTLDGNIVKYLRHGQTDAGTHYYNWNGTNNGGSKVARGLYFVRVIGPGIDETRKVMCVK